MYFAFVVIPKNPTRPLYGIIKFLIKYLILVEIVQQHNITAIVHRPTVIQLHRLIVLVLNHEMD